MENQRIQRKNTVYEVFYYAWSLLMVIFEYFQTRQLQDKRLTVFANIFSFCYLK